VAELPSPPDPSEVQIRYASTDDDVIAIHRFLLIVAMPAMRGPANPVKSLNEIIRVTKYEAAIMAVLGDRMVGTMGIIKPTWWYNDVEFLTDRWHFVLPQYWHGPVNKALMTEALSIAAEAELEFVHNGKLREQKSGAFLLMPRLYLPESATLPQGDHDVLRQSDHNVN